MSMLRRLTAVIEREGDGYVAICPEFDLVSQGTTVEEARSNLTEALTLFFETAHASEIDRRSQRESSSLM
jgi:predicted RNase H-like HicB family nuclease